MSMIDPCRGQRESAEGEPYLPRRMTGRCTSGAERGGGKLAHAVDNVGWAPALCGAKPGRLSGGWSNLEQERVTCKRCLRKLERGTD